MEGNVQHVAKQGSKFDGKNANDFLEWSSKLRVSLSLYNKPTFEIVRGSQRLPDLDNDQATTREGLGAIIICSASSTSRQHLAQLSLSGGGLKEKLERTE